MSQLPIGIVATDTGHIGHTNELHRLHNMLDDALASPGYVIYKGTDGWAVATLATAGIAATVHTHTESQISDLTAHYDSDDFATDFAAADFDGLDGDAFHDNVTGEIAAISAKSAPVDADIILIEDSAASNSKKKSTVGALRAHTVRKTSAYTVTVEDDVVLVDSAAGTVAITLPAVSAVDLHSVLIKRIDGANAVTITRAGSDTIETDEDSVTSKSLNSIGAHWSAVAVDTDSAWYTIGEHGTIG